MKKHLRTLGASLLVVPLLFASVASAEMVQDMPTPAPDNTQKTTIQQRIKARKEAAKEKLTTAQSNAIKARCSAAKGIITNVQKRVSTFQTSRAQRYMELVEKLETFSARLEAADVDTSTYDQQVKELRAMVDDFDADIEELKQAVDDLQNMDCATDPEGFVATIKSAVQLRKAVIEQGRNFRKHLRETIKPTLVAIKADLQETKQPQGEQ